jgi:hypothetical protein
VGVSYIDYFVLPSDAGATRCKNYGDWDTSVIPSTAQSCTQYDVFSHFNQPVYIIRSSFSIPEAFPYEWHILEETILFWNRGKKTNSVI